MPAVFAGTGALLAAGVLAALATYRRRAFRHRRPGRTITPTPPELIPTEKAVRAAGGTAAVDVEFLDHALRSLTHAAAAGPDAALPDVIAARMLGDRLDLRLAQPHTADPPAHWTADESGLWWSTTTGDQPPAGPGNAADYPAPYPALAGVGYTEDGQRWLLDLERAGSITVTGPPQRRLDLARFLAAELAVNAWSDHMDVTMAGFGAELLDLNPARLHHDDGLDAAAEQVLAEIDAAHRIAHEAGVDTLTARLRGTAGEPWIPHLLLLAPHSTETHTGTLHRLLSTLDRHPGRAAAAVIIAGDHPDAPTSRWRLSISGDGHLSIPELDVTLLAQQLPADHAPALTALLRAARAHGDAPMPAATGDRPWQEYSDAAGALRRDLTQPRTTPPTPPSAPPSGSTTTVAPTPSAAPGSEQAPAHTPSEDTDLPGGPAAASLLPRPDRTYLERSATTATDLQTLAPQVGGSLRSKIESADDQLEADLAAWHDPDSPLPKLTLLGPVEVRAHGDRGGITGRIGFYTEIVAYLATRDHGATAEQLADAFDLQLTRARTDVSVTRKWLGTNPRTGRPHLPKGLHAQPNRGIGIYRLEDVLTDADLFRRLRLRGQARGPAGITDLQTALDLVSGPPFTQLRPGGYTWLADTPLEHYWVPAIVDVAHILTTHHLAEGNPAPARAAAETALLAAPYEEIPRLDLAAAQHAQGHHQQADQYLRDHICNRADDGAPADLTQRTTDIIRRHGWLNPTAS